MWQCVDVGPRGTKRAACLRLYHHTNAAARPKGLTLHRRRDPAANLTFQRMTSELGTLSDEHIIPVETNGKSYVYMPRPCTWGYPLSQQA